jgi:hypothetical protein
MVGSARRGAGRGSGETSDASRLRKAVPADSGLACGRSFAS